MAYTDTVGRLARACGDRVAGLHARYADGEIALEEFVAAALAVLNGSRSRAVALADLALATELSRLRAAVVLPLGLVPEAATRTQIDDVIASEPYRLDALAAVAVLGRADTFATAQQAYADGMRERDVELWTRNPNTGACPVCSDLATGAVDITVPMWTHRGCGCTQQPIK